MDKKTEMERKRVARERELRRAMAEGEKCEWEIREGDTGGGEGGKEGQKERDKGWLLAGAAC